MNNYWIESHPYKMALIVSIITSLVYSMIYFSSFGTKELTGLYFAIPFIFGADYGVAGLFDLSERGKR